MKQTRPVGAGPRGPAWLWILITAFFIVSMAYVRLYVYPDQVVPLSYSIPLMAYLYSRRMGLMWIASGAFVGLVFTKIVMIPSDLGSRDSIVFGVMHIATILITAAVIHRVVALSGHLQLTIDSLEKTNAELESSNEELAAREEEITQQNEELQAQAEELEQQMEELNCQAEELQSLNEHLATRERIVNEMLESPAAVAGESDVRESIGAAAHKLLGGRVAAVCHVARDGSRHELIGACAGAATNESTLASIVADRKVAAFIADTRERPDLSVPSFAGRRAGSVMAAPVRTGESVGGAIEFYSLETGAWTDEELRIAQWIADQYGRLMHNALLRSDLNRQRELLRTLTDNAWGALVVTDDRGRVTYMNPAANKLARLKTIDGDPPHVHDLFHDSSHTSDSCPLTEPAERSRCFSDTVHTEDGRAVPVQCVASPILSNGKPSLVVYEIHDVSEQQRLQREREQLLESERAARIEVERASRAKDEFVATLSHELRTPLNAILGWATLLSRPGTQDAASLGEGLQVIERNARHQAQLISDLLDISRITAGKVRLELCPVQLEEIISSAVSSLRPAAEAKSIRIQVDCAPIDRVVHGDKDRLQQVLWNLLANAIKFTSEGGEISVCLRSVAACAEIQICDNGVGIERDHLTNIFERYRQADASTTRLHSGLGLGLAITKHLVELHGGSILAASDGPGHGAVFTVLLPSVPVGRASGIMPAAPQSLDRPAAQDLSGIQGLRILAVDDDADARDLVRRLLEDHGAAVVTASNANAALATLAAQKVDLLISDIGLPEVDGYTLIRRLRAEVPEPACRVPAIAVTAFARTEDRTRAILAGFQAHLSKPIEAKELFATIASVVSLGRGNDA